MKPATLDIVVPSYRLKEAFLLPILQLERPANLQVQFIVIADHPEAIPSPRLQAAFETQGVRFLRNPVNLGAAGSRNKGIDVSTAEWVLFLDDDITPDPGLLQEYANAIQKYPQAIGMVGLIALPPADNAFTKAVIASASMDIFGIAAKKSETAWGATANLLCRRSAIGTIRFSELYPKMGGGEDVDFCFRIREQNGLQNFICLPEARVVHPWWDHGAASWKRSFRYGQGNSLLPAQHPDYGFYDFLTTPEMLLLGALLLPLLHLAGVLSVPAIFGFLGGLLLIEMIATGIQTIKRCKAFSLPVLGYSIALRLVYEFGWLQGVLVQKKWSAIGLRFKEDGRPPQWSWLRSNTRKLTKWILYPALTLLCLSH